ncbi:hypothetical protein ACEQ8H_006833 [Pleosporales sp. CAS-2024a]
MADSEESPSSLLAPYYQNQSCDPFTPQSKTCELGKYAVYSVNASSAADVAAAVKFSRSKNIRLAIKNTGHDFLGRSAGTGSLSVWVHNLKTHEFFPNYTSEFYNGTALKFGAGIRGFEAVKVAHRHTVQVVTGFCPAVGVIGGYLQGGGSRPLGSFRGVAADQVLEYEAVTASGNLITASSTQNSDLYWALSGGGGGTYAIVVSTTIRAFEDVPIGGASLTFSRQNVETHLVYDLLGQVFDLVSSLIDVGVQFAREITKKSFHMGPVTAPGFNAQQVRELLAPFTSRLEASGIVYELHVTEMPNYKSHLDEYLGPMPAGRYQANTMPGTTLIPRDSLRINRTALVEVTKRITEDSASFVVFIAANLEGSKTKEAVAANAVPPQWRQAAVHALGMLMWDFNIPHEEMLARHTEFIDFTVPQLKAALPHHAGTYLNEAHVGIKNWRDEFFGVNYERLRHIKKVYDPSDLFYAEYSVGSEAWFRASDERLCRTLQP